MIRITGDSSEVGFIPDFFYDKHEVTNRDYKAFIDAGGYSNRGYWKYPFHSDVKTLEWEEAISLFVDQTGRPGPSTWVAGDYPDGEDDYPVAGVSWYEAAAYSAFRENDLPTNYHWSRANLMRPEANPFGSPDLPLSLLAPQSNFSGDGPASIGTYPGIGANGAYDTVGNVREWSFNEYEGGRSIRGGAWNDSYFSTGMRITKLPPFDRSSQNGFRNVRYIERDNIPEAAFEPFLNTREGDDYRHVEPVSDEIFQVYKENFSYDREPLNAVVEYRDETAEDWTKDKVSFDAAYDDDRVDAYLYLPKNAAKPYQTIIIFPYSTGQRSSERLEASWFDYYMKNGRAVLFPVYKHTFERGGSEQDYWDLFLDLSTRRYFDAVTKMALDFRRSIDYLETRDDIDATKLAYYSLSWGGELVSIITSVEDRVKLNIVNVGGLRGWDKGGRIYPMADPINYVSRVTVPTLMLNGRYDMIYQYEKVVEPMYDLLGTPDEDKLLKTYPTDHYVPMNELIKESLNWLDRYFGKVN
jgi:dienelactone hydrolase